MTTPPEAPPDTTGWTWYHQVITAAMGSALVGDLYTARTADDLIVLSWAQTTDSINLSVPDDGHAPLTDALRARLEHRQWTRRENRWTARTAWEPDIAVIGRTAAEVVHVVRDLLDYTDPQALTFEGTHVPSGRILTLPAAPEEFEHAKTTCNYRFGDLDLVQTGVQAFAERARPGSRVIAAVTRPAERTPDGDGDYGELGYETVMIGPGADGEPAVLVCVYTGPSRQFGYVSVPQHPPVDPDDPVIRVEPGSVQHVRAVLQGYGTHALSDALERNPHQRAELTDLIAAGRVEAHLIDVPLGQPVTATPLRLAPEQLDVATLRLPEPTAWSHYLYAVGAWMAIAVHGDELVIQRAGTRLVRLVMGAETVAFEAAVSPVTSAQHFGDLTSSGWKQARPDADMPQAWFKTMAWNPSPEYIAALVDLIEYLLRGALSVAEPAELLTVGANGFGDARVPLPDDERATAAWRVGRSRYRELLLRGRIADAGVRTAYPSAVQVSFVPMIGSARPGRGAPGYHFLDLVYLVDEPGERPGLLVVAVSPEDGTVGERSWAPQATEAYVEVLFGDSRGLAADVLREPQHSARFAEILADPHPDSVRLSHITIVDTTASMKDLPVDGAALAAKLVVPG